MEENTAEKKKRNITKKQMAHVNKYIKNHYDSASIIFPAGSLEMLRGYAKDHNISMNELYRNALSSYTGLNLNLTAKEESQEN